MTIRSSNVTDDVTEHLRRRGMAPVGSELTVTPLTGGVSNDVVSVHGEGIDVVVKRALGRLRVEQDWVADVNRLTTEGRALRLAATVNPDLVPTVLDLADGYLVIERAPDHWRTWKHDLMAGIVDVHVAGRLGEFLARLQSATLARIDDLRADFGSWTAFEQLRVEPFHVQVRNRHPDIASEVDRTIAVMKEVPACVVHGDYSPKNILVGDSDADVWVIDWEVAHLGDPTFDAAWVVGHLLLKSIRRPELAEHYRNAAAVFLDALGQGEVELRRQLVRQTGVLVLARVDGRSPVDYLDQGGRAVARSVGLRMLGTSSHSVLDAWRLLP
ncbi:aminoglycoside phosphotransferase (APT) family kinase protein [Rhodococcus erythropolis]|uniref:phosphotransferase family protein n=1 Tax=Rhodococcus erythropolis TaxID=1833 RepID=UPI00216710FE|nr:aminoglycoside phosphotransferase family protein [Rhodococcus erythropolis]MCS4257821.1 aminoglycoside phosphotransferase (APT) family kinase protein [Rhodococcus erythropolis]MCW2425122.1 aminoglycoside phosphotransferase (APT) family kinase protein [Rhodococcus erythropolis]